MECIGNIISKFLLLFYKLFQSFCNQKAMCKMYFHGKQFQKNIYIVIQFDPDPQFR